MFRRDKFITEIQDQIHSVHQGIEDARDEQERVEYTNKISYLYRSLGETYFRMFYSSFNFLYLTHAEVYFQLAIDALSSIQQSPSLLLNFSLLAAQQEKLFYQDDASQHYVAAITEYRSTERVPEQMAHNYNLRNRHPLFHQPHVKRVRFLPPAGYVLPAPSEDIEETMELDGVETIVNFGS